MRLQTPEFSTWLSWSMGLGWGAMVGLRVLHLRSWQRHTTPLPSMPSSTTNSLLYHLSTAVCSLGLVATVEGQRESEREQSRDTGRSPTTLGRNWSQAARGD